jgi:hypothetical protein
MKSKRDSNCKVRLTKLPIASSGRFSLPLEFSDMKPWKVTSKRLITYSKLLLETVLPLVEGDLETQVEAVPLDVLDRVLIDRLSGFGEDVMLLCCQ